MNDISLGFSEFALGIVLEEVVPCVSRIRMTIIIDYYDKVDA